MKISADYLTDTSRATAQELFVERPSQLHGGERLDDYAQAHLNIDSRNLQNGGLGITIDRYTIAPDHGDLSLYESDSDTVELIYDVSGELKGVRDIPRGYDAQWSMDRIADVLFPKRREEWRLRIARRTDALVQAAKTLL